jgi:hypothetical protein
VIPVGHYVPSFVPHLTEKDNVTYSGIPVQYQADIPDPVVADILAREPGTPAPGWLRVPRVVVAGGSLVLVAAVVLLVLFVRRPAHPATTVLANDSVSPTSFVRPPAIPSGLPGSSVRLTCGRSVSYTDRSGQMWGADRFFEGGAAFDSPRQYVARAIDPKLFQNGRTGDFSYRIPLAKGNYELRLGFLETNFGPSTPAGGGEYSRTFDVKANGRTLLDDFDIYADANGTNVADMRVFKDISPNSDGLLNLEFRSRRGPALINTIELTPAPHHRLNPIRIVAQENFVTLPNGTVWSPDVYFIGGVLANHAVPIAGNDSDLYARERFGHFDYAIPVDAGTYAVSLYFAETYFGEGNQGGGGPGSRVFDIFCNGAVLARNFDILKETTMNQELVKTFHGLTPNAQGKLALSFVPVHNYASLYALEVVDESQ